jgi:GNAT superfamily N-acetyltransferase
VKRTLDDIATAACARVFEPLISERVVRVETIDLEPEPGYWESWALCITKGKVSSPYISGGRILIGVDCTPASYLVGSPSMIAGLVWVTEYGQKKITHICVEEELRQRGIGRALIAAYRKWVSKKVYLSGPFSEAGLAFAQRLRGKAALLHGLGVVGRSK